MANGRAITYACIQAFPAPKDVKGQALRQWRRDHHWSPNQLRHAALTRVRKEAGLDAARGVAGHSKVETTQIYAERDFQQTMMLMRRIG